MSVPNYSHVPQKLYATGLYDLRSHEGQAAFTDSVVSTLNGIDPNFRHLKKSPSQTHVHLHGEDSVLYLLPNNKALAVDFIGGAGGANPQPGWIVGTHEYTHADAHDPTEHGIGGSAPTPIPPSQPYPDERTWWPQVFDVEVAKRYQQAGKVYPDGPAAFRWASRTAYDIRDGLTKEQSLDKHLEELERELGLP